MCNALLSAITAHTVLPAAERMAGEMNRELHGRPLPFPVLDWPRHAEAIVQLTVPEFEYQRSDAPTTLHFVGPISSTGSHAPLPGWCRNELDGSRPVVHITQGTMANLDYRQIIAPPSKHSPTTTCSWSCPRVGARSTRSRGYPGSPAPPSTSPYDDLPPKVDIYVTSSGHEDKPEVAARVAWSGVGRRLNTETPSPAAVGDAVRLVLRDPRYPASAERLAARMADAGGLTQAPRSSTDSRRLPRIALTRMAALGVAPSGGR